MTALVITRERFALRRGFREAELHGLAAAHARSWRYGDSALRFAYRVGIDRFREEPRVRPFGPADPGSAA
jgi:hypothetical protein